MPLGMKGQLRATYRMDRDPLDRLGVSKAISDTRNNLPKDPSAVSAV